jgi:hypothetical protein
MDEDMLTYLHIADVDRPDEPKEVYRLLDRELTVGMIIEKSQTEGYIPYEVISYTHKDKVFENRDLVEVYVKKHPMIKYEKNESLNSPLIDALNIFLLRS